MLNFFDPLEESKEFFVNVLLNSLGKQNAINSRSEQKAAIISS